MSKKPKREKVLLCLVSGRHVFHTGEITGGIQSSNNAHYVDVEIPMRRGAQRGRKVLTRVFLREKKIPGVFIISLSKNDYENALYYKGES